MSEKPEYLMRGIPADYVDHFWNFAEPYIKRALDHANGEISHLDLKQRCMERDAQLWLMFDGQRIVGAGTTEIVTYPRKKICRIITIAGTGFDDWMGLAQDVISAWARSQGCVAMECYVRKGFVPKLVNIGYKHKYSVCHIPLE